MKKTHEGKGKDSVWRDVNTPTGFLVQVAQTAFYDPIIKPFPKQSGEKKTGGSKIIILCGQHGQIKTAVYILFLLLVFFFFFVFQKKKRKKEEVGGGDMKYQNDERSRTGPARKRARGRGWVAQFVNA